MLTRRKFCKGLIGSSIVLGSSFNTLFQTLSPSRLVKVKLKRMVIKPKIRVLGLGGAGNNAINYMLRSHLTRVEFIAANTDFKRLSSSLANHRIQLGTKLTNGLGSSANPGIGQQATLEAKEEIQTALKGSDLVFIVAGMGGGTGTGGGHVIAKISKELGIPTVAVITQPFHFEGKERIRNAILGTGALRLEADVLISISNDRFVINPKMPFLQVLTWLDEAMFYALDLAKEFFASLDPSAPDYGQLKNEALESVRGAIKTHFPEGSMELIESASARGGNGLLEATQKALPIPFLQKVINFFLFIVLVLCINPSLTYPLNLTLDNAPSQVYFSPNGGCTSSIVREINLVKSEILVQAYSFTSQPIAKALVSAFRRGVNVQTLLDKSQKSEKYTSAAFLANMGIPTYIDSAHAIAHNKIMIIDRETVITGSFNFTKAAEEKNAENLLIINSKELAKIYRDNWNRHKNHSEPYPARY